MLTKNKTKCTLTVNFPGTKNVLPVVAYLVPGLMGVHNNVVSSG